MMARQRRLWLEGAPYHLFSRGSNRQPIFLDQGDYHDFATVFATAARQHELECFAWAFMPNHWHLLVRSPAEGLSQFMRDVNHRYALRFNRRWDRSAHLFKNRFGCVPQTSQEQFLATLRYILRNPVEAGLAPSVDRSTWTSYEATIGAVPAPTFLSVRELLENFGGDSGRAKASFRTFVSS